MCTPQYFNLYEYYNAGKFVCFLNVLISETNASFIAPQINPGEPAEHS